MWQNLSLNLPTNPLLNKWEKFHWLTQQSIQKHHLSKQFIIANVRVLLEAELCFSRVSGPALVVCYPGLQAPARCHRLYQLHPASVRSPGAVHWRRRRHHLALGKHKSGTVVLRPICFDKWLTATGKTFIPHEVISPLCYAIIWRCFLNKSLITLN